MNRAAQPCLASPRPASPRPALPSPARPCHASPSHAQPRPAMPCPASPRLALPGPALPCHAVPGLPAQSIPGQNLEFTVQPAECSEAKRPPPFLKEVDEFLLFDFAVGEYFEPKR